MIFKKQDLKRANKKNYCSQAKNLQKKGLKTETFKRQCVILNKKSRGQLT